MDTGNFGSFEDVWRAAQFRAVVLTVGCFETLLERWFTTFHCSRKGKTHGHNPRKNPVGHSIGPHLLLAQTQLQITMSGWILLVFTSAVVLIRSI